MMTAGFLAMVLVGVSLGLIGGGGSILTVPILVYLMALSPEVATGYSLFVVGIASVVGAAQYHRQKLIDYRTGIVFAVPSFVGTFAARRLLVPALPEEIWRLPSGGVFARGDLIMLVFGAVMVIAAVSMIRPGTRREGAGAPPPRMNLPLIAAEGLGVGLLTGFVGAGGGFLVIPALVLLARMPMKTAIGTSLAIIALKSLVGFTGDLSAGIRPDWPFLLGITAVAVAGIFAGTYAGRRIKGDRLKPAFGWFVLVIGSLVFAQAMV